MKAYSYRTTSIHTQLVRSEVRPRVVHEKLLEAGLARNVGMVDAVLVQSLLDKLDVHVAHAKLEILAVALLCVVLPDNAATKNADKVNGALLLDAEARKSHVHVDLHHVLSRPDDAEAALRRRHVVNWNSRHGRDDAEKVDHLHVEMHKRSLRARKELDKDLDALVCEKRNDGKDLRQLNWWNCRNRHFFCIRLSRSATYDPQPTQIAL